MCAVNSGGCKVRTPKRSPSLLLYLVTLLSLPLTRLSPAHGHFTRQLVAFRLITTSSMRRPLSSSTLHSFLPQRQRHVCCHRVPLLSLDQSGAHTGTHAELHSTDSSHMPLKGPLRDQISPRLTPPTTTNIITTPSLCVEAAQDIALKLVVSLFYYFGM